MARADANVGANDIDYKKALGADDGGLVSNAVEAVKGIAGKVADKLDPLTEQYAALFKTGLRTPVMRKPSDYDMAFEEAWFPSMDGVPLEAWFIPASSNKLLIINHPMTCNRYGFPGHLPEYKSYFGGFEVNFLPELKALHDAGYNILTYDLRNCGRSAKATAGSAASAFSNVATWSARCATHARIRSWARCARACSAAAWAATRRSSPCRNGLTSSGISKRSSS